MVSFMNVKAPTKFRSPNTHFKIGLTGIASNLIADPHPTPPLCVCVTLLLLTLQKQKGYPLEFLEADENTLLVLLYYY